MDLTGAQRAELASRIEAARNRRYRGNKKAAYTAAQVNSETWRRAEAGLSIKPTSLVAIVGTLWPETDGDWRNLDPPLGGTVDDAEEVRRSNLPPGTKVRLLAILEAEPSELRLSAGQLLRNRGLAEHFDAEEDAEAAIDDTPASGSA